MLEDKLPELIRLTYNIKILVTASYKAKESLAAKGLSPAIFLDRFYRQRLRGPTQVSFRFKQKQMRPLPEFVTIDIDDYSIIRREDKNSIEDIDQEILYRKIYQSLNHQQLKYIRNTDKSVFADKSSVQKFLNNQSFDWFQNSMKTYFYAMSLGQDNYKVSTADQPLGLCYIIEVQKEKTAKQIFDKLRNEKDLLLRKLYQLNPDQQKNVKTMIIILFDVSQQCTIQQALTYTAYFKQIAEISSSLIFRLAINGQDICDSVQWSRFSRPILHFSYSLKSSDPVRMITADEFPKLQEVVSHHKQTIKKALESRLQELAKKYEQANKATKMIASFFKGTTSNDKQQMELRELTDKMFILQDYKRAYELYKSLSKKMEKRNPLAQANIAEMIQLCLAMSKFHNVKLKSDPYNEIQKYADKILKYYENKSRCKLQRYLIFLVYVFHTFKSFDKQFIRGIFHPKLRAVLGDQNANLNVVGILIYEQHTNMYLLFNNIDYRRYCYSLTRVASRFSDAKLFNYARKCLLIVEPLYRQSFANIQKYQQTQLGHQFLEVKNFRESLKCLKTAWEIYVSRMQSEDLQKNDQQLVKHIENYNKMMREIEKSSPIELTELIFPNLKIPIIHALNLQTKDEILSFDEKSGTKWQDIGDAILDSKELMSAGLNQREFRNMFRAFDSGVSEQKYLIHRFNSNNITDYVLKKNSRNAYVGEPIRLSFYMRNPLRGDIDVSNIKVLLKTKFQSVKIETECNTICIKGFQSQKVAFTLTPTQAGFLQVERLEWVFMKLLTQYRIKQPQQIKSDAKSCYFKINIHPRVGCLEAQAFFQDYYYQGEKAKMKIKFTNVGIQKVTKIYIASEEDQMLGFKLYDLNADILPQTSEQFQFDISIPLVHSKIQSEEEKKINKFLILYKTGDKYRICRTLNKFNILRIAKFNNISCERFSTHLHLLSFSKRKNSNKEDASALEWIIIPKGFQIVKKETADLALQTNYFFFIRKDNFGMSKFQFESWAKDINSYPEQFLKLEQPKDEINALNIRFLWRKQQKSGYISKLNIPITINQYGYLSTIYPIGFKINYDKEMKYNFKKNPYLQIPIQIKLKNVLYNDDLKVTIKFIDGVETDSCWEGVTERKMTLKIGSQQKINVKYVVVRPGIYNLSREIKYEISNSKSQTVKISHCQYQQLYLTIKNDGAVENKIDFEDAFKQFSVVSTAKQTTNKIENESLI